MRERSAGIERMEQKMSIEENFPVMTEEQVAEMLQISVHTLIKHRLNGDAPPHLKVGSKYRYVRKSVEVWLQENEIQPLDKAEGE